MRRRAALRWLLASVALAAVAGAEPVTPNPPGGPVRRWNPATVETVSGRVETVERVARRPGGAAGVHVTLRDADGETHRVRLGPSWWLDRQDLKIAAGDELVVKGSRIGTGDRQAILAGEVRKGDRTLVLRDPAGVPAWGGGRRRTPRP